MTGLRAALLGAAAVVAIGVPVALVVAGGDDGSPEPHAAGDPVSAAPSQAPEPVEEAAGPPGRGAKGGNGRGPKGGKGRGPEERPSPRAAQRPGKPYLDGVAAPVGVDDSGARAARAVDEVLGARTDVGHPRVIGSSCSGGRCLVRFWSTPRGRGEVLRMAARILPGVFGDGVRSAVLYVHHEPTTLTRDERAAFMTLTCTGADVDACRVTHTAGGHQRSVIRRGQLSVGEASRGRGNRGR
jgi:hypothetical protein